MVVYNWREYTPAQLIKIMHGRYPDSLVSVANMLSRLKMDLSRLDDKPPDEYLAALKLTPDEYETLKENQDESRARAANNVPVITNVDDIYMQAIRLLKTNEPSKLVSALLVLTGLRPIDIFAKAEFAPPVKQAKYNAFSVAQVRFAKRKQDGPQVPRNRVFLAPAKLILPAIDKVRKYYKTANMTAIQINNSLKLKQLKDDYPMVKDPSPRLFRRLFASLGHYWFSDFSGKEASLAAWASHHLGHEWFGQQALPYQSIKINTPRLSPLKVFDSK